MRTATLLAFLGAVVLVGAGVGVAVGGVPAVSSLWASPQDQGPRIEETGLHGFETAGPTCADPRSDNESVLSLPVPGGRRLSYANNVSVERRKSDLGASLEKIGPRRYQLALSRQPKGDSADCHLEVRYNATLNVSTPDSYTIVVTVDGELQTVLWSTPQASGGSSRTGGPGYGGGNATASVETGSG